MDDPPDTPNLDRMDALPIQEITRFLKWLRSEYSICEYVHPGEMDNPPPFKVYSWFEIEGEAMTFSEARAWVAENVEDVADSIINISGEEVRKHATVHTGTDSEFIEATGSEPDRGLLSQEENINPNYTNKGFHPIRESNEDLVYEFFDLDPEEIEEERRELLKHLPI